MEYTKRNPSYGNDISVKISRMSELLKHRECRRALQPKPWTLEGA